MFTEGLLVSQHLRALHYNVLMLFENDSYSFLLLYASLVTMDDAHDYVWVCSEGKVRCNNIVGIVSEVKHCNKLTLAPLHTGLDEGKWPFNHHDSLFDWELCPKASTLPASKASQRLCSASSSPVAVFLLVCFAMLLLQCPSPHGILRVVSLYRLYHQYLFIHCFLTVFLLLCKAMPIMGMTWKGAVSCLCFTAQLHPLLTLRGGTGWIQFIVEVAVCLPHI